ncbi:conjugal transfer protein [Streptomyces sp. SID14478]|uniref:conjugal transfer protein n=1 Tax=Streptomyces sp. SID14478 TaxID=2706073 RepID=UPI0013DCDE92|nr:conjugal transfer protein [Streptomyces sp. SID14478]NEB75971.1 conjugal transfer protein [Streptomyces sp. SID14478]
MPASTHESPPTVAGLDLERTRRRVRMGRAGMWASLAAGPLALAFVVTQPSVRVVAQSAPAPVRTTQTSVAVDPGGYAAEFVDAWLRSDAGQPDSSFAVRAQQLGPDVLLPEPAKGAKAPQRVSAVRSVRGAHGQWSVTVAVQDAGQVRYFAVPLAASSSAGAVTVTGTPALVAGPGAVKAAASPYTVDVPDGPLTETVGDFLSAYLSGSGEVERYLAPRTRLTAVTPAVADRVGLESVSAREKTAAGEQVPGDSTRVHVQVSVTAQSAAGRWPLSYELTLAARGGRWEIAALTSGGGEEQ